MTSCPSLLQKEREEDRGWREVGQAEGSSKRLFICHGDGDRVLSIKREA